MESIDLLNLNTEVLSIPENCAGHAIIQLLELKDPGLSFLGPLARAIYFIESERLEAIDAREALNTCYVIDDSFSGDCLLVDPDDYEHPSISEDVNHAIKRVFRGMEITLRFESWGNETFYFHYCHDFLRAVPGVTWPTSLLDNGGKFNEWAFSSLDAVNADTVPGARPSDSGEFLGILSYTLSGINQLSVKGPTYTDQKCESTWENLSEEYTQRYPKSANSDHEGQMCWLHYLSAAQAKLLGIAASGKDAIGENPDYPEWVPKAVSEDELESTWISPDELQESYSNGEASGPQSTEAWLALGCGSNWYPGADIIEGDTEDRAADSLVFNPMARPLITAQITRGDKILPSEILTLRPYLILLGKMLAK